MFSSVHTRRASRGFTLVEVLIATALLGFSLIVMFGLHTQAVRSNAMARKVTDCTYMAQTKMEELIAWEWLSSSGRSGTDMSDGMSSMATEWAPLYHPAGGTDPTPVNNRWEPKGSESANAPAATYYVTWQVEDTSTNGDWLQIWVRCSWKDRSFGTWHGTTISSYRFQDQ